MKYSKYNLVFADSVKGKYILFNTLTGHSFLVSSEIANMLQDGKVDSLDEETKTQFVKYGIVVDDKIDETRYFSYFHNKAKFGTFSVSSTVLLTWACNFACVYCYEGAGAITDFMNEASADKYVKFMINNAEARNAKSM